MTNDRSPQLSRGTSKQDVAATLRKLGLEDLADEALRDLPDQPDNLELGKFCERHGISLDDVVSRRGGSP